MTKTENKIFNDLFSVLFTACLSALVISCCEYFLIAVKPRSRVIPIIQMMIFFMIILLFDFYYKWKKRKLQIVKNNGIP